MTLKGYCGVTVVEDESLTCGFVLQGEGGGLEGAYGTWRRSSMDFGLSIRLPLAVRPCTCCGNTLRPSAGLHAAVVESDLFLNKMRGIVSRRKQCFRCS